MTPHESPGESRNVEQGYRKSTPASKLHPGNPHSETESETSATVKSINGRGYRRRSARSPKPFQVVVDDLLQGRWGRKIHDGWWGGDEDTSRGEDRCRIGCSGRDGRRSEGERRCASSNECESLRIIVQAKKRKSPSSLGKRELSVEICARKGESPERCGAPTDDQQGWQVNSTHELNYRRSFGNCIPKRARLCWFSLPVVDRHGSSGARGMTAAPRRQVFNGFVIRDMRVQGNTTSPLGIKGARIATMEGQLTPSHSFSI